MLFGSAKSVFGSEAMELGGVRVGALGNRTFVTDIAENPAIVDLDGVSIEPQTISYRAIFPRSQIRDAELEVYEMSSGADHVVKTLQAPLDDAGEGQAVLPAGTTLIGGAPVRVRLIVNVTEGEIPRVSSRQILGEAFEMSPEDYTEASVDDQAVDVGGVSWALLRRSSREVNPVPPPNLTWAIRGAPGGLIDPGSEAPATGLYTATLVVPPTKDGVVGAELRLGGRVLGLSQAIGIVVGEPVEGTLTGSRDALPADGWSKVELTISDIKDAAGNVIEDGTEVFWEMVSGDDGTLEATTTLTVGGATTNTYRAGTEAAAVTIRASAGSMSREIEISEKPLRASVTIRVSSGTTHLAEAIFESDAGFPDDGTPVSWGATGGELRPWRDTLEGGRTSADFTLSWQSLRRVMFWPYVFATVGRARVGLTVNPGDLRPGKPRVQLTERFLLSEGAASTQVEGGTMQASVDRLAAEPGAEPTEESSLVATVFGEPGAEVRLALGTPYSPVRLPIALFPMDSVVDGSVVDLKGGPEGIAGDGVAVDGAGARWMSPALRFTGVGGVEVQGGVSQRLTREFGLNGYMRFDSPRDGEVILARSGSFELKTVEAGGLVYVQFEVVSGGNPYEVRTSRPIMAGRWYHFAAHVNKGRIWLGLGEGEPVAVGPEVAEIDEGEEWLQIGPNFNGSLDEIEIFDLAKSPFASFAPQSAPSHPTETVVTLDDQGQAEVAFYRIAEPAAASQALSFSASSSGWTGAGSDPNGEALRMREGQSQIYIPEDPVSDWELGMEETISGRFGDRVATQCLEGLATGEEGGAVGAACDIAIGFIPYVGQYVQGAQSARDVARTAIAFSQGKRGVGTYVVGSLAVVGLALAAWPVLSGVSGVLRRARTAVALMDDGERLIARTALQAVGKEAGLHSDEVSRSLVEILGRVETDSAKEALQRLLRQVKGSARTARPLERLATQLGPDRLVIVLDRVVTSAGGEVGARLIRVLDSLKLPASAAERLSDDAIEGMGVLLKHGADHGWAVGRVSKVWSDVRALSAGSEQVQKFDNFFRWIKAGEQRNIKGWTDLLKTAGGGKPDGLLSRNATQGLYNVLEHLDSIQWKYVVELERGVGNLVPPRYLRYERYIDIVLDIPGRGEVYRELKSLKAGSYFGFGGQVTKDIKGVLNAAYLGGNRYDMDKMREGLQRLEYYLRGSQSQMARVEAGLQRKIRRILSESNLPDEMTSLITIVLENRSLPL